MTAPLYKPNKWETAVVHHMISYGILDLEHRARQAYAPHGGNDGQS